MALYRRLFKTVHSFDAVRFMQRPQLSPHPVSAPGEYDSRHDAQPSFHTGAVVDC
jgi:hypothetical protein